MPELAEVETVCRVMRRVLVGKRITRVEVAADTLVFESPRRNIEDALEGRTVRGIGRRGKTFWIELAGAGPTVYGHLGMSGWIREIGGHNGVRLQAHGDAPLDDEAGRPRFLKLLLEARGGGAIAFTDPRRLGRIWLGPDPADERRIRRLGRDAFDDLPSPKELAALFARRKIPIKALLLDQGALAGLGNWLADEVLYQARLAPHRLASSLDASEVASLRRAIRTVVGHAVKVGADSERYPRTWLFEHRWGGSRGSQQINGHAIRRDEVGGRTTAWVPALQK
ncbi:MAG TPA: DNA-formamidopyrimidine glycosylase family protein [Kofleriaceae bacterium]|nr:DNA-formamidopyrimidine glycosylase family protein [Kofleriaceae bacterium]